MVCGEHAHAHDEAQTQQHGAQSEDVRYALVFLHPGVTCHWSRHWDAEDAGGSLAGMGDWCPLH